MAGACGSCTSEYCLRAIAGPGLSTAAPVSWFQLLSLLSLLVFQGTTVLSSGYSIIVGYKPEKRQAEACHNLYNGGKMNADGM